MTLPGDNALEDEVKANAVNLLPELKEKLGTDADGVSDETLRKFLFWKPSVDRAAGRFHDHVKWRKEVPWAFDSTPLQASKDDDLRRVIESEVIVAPEGVVAKDGSTLLVGRLRNNDMSDGRTAEDVVRMCLYTIDRVLERESTQLHGITIFHDMKDVCRGNVAPSIPKILFHAILGHFPVRISAVYILHAPFFIRGLFKVISLSFPTKVRARVQFVNDTNDVFKAVDKDSLLLEHGGKVDHNQKGWLARQIQREKEGTMQSLVDCYNPE